MSILDNRPSLAREVDRIAEAAGYLGRKAGPSATAATSPSTSPNT